MNLNNTKMYNCACGCAVDRTGIMRSMRLGKFIYRCKEHKDGLVVSKFGYCEECDNKFNIPLSRNSNPTRCQLCSDERYTDNLRPVKTRKWDCKNYEDCLYNKPRVAAFNCDKCNEYGKERPKIDLIRTHDHCVDDRSSMPKANPGGKN